MKYPVAWGLSEEEVRAAAACAGEEVMIRNRFMEMNAPRDSSSVSKYYHLAHAVSEKVVSQPSMLRAGTLRDYQLVGLQWMLSLYNNKLNGILADEMGLGKTVQVMALIAYLMEFKGNYGPHLIIVPNAVMVNWKVSFQLFHFTDIFSSELHTWLPSVSCIFYAGGKDYRSKLYSQEILAMKFNVLVTTYEFIMYDRSRLSKIDWKYIIIDEAQRMKDRDSVLARDLDRYRCQRRLLLTGTPLQNDLKELWSLLNLLLPEVFDNKKAFNDWFSKPFQKEVSTQNTEDDWLETEKKVIIIHRLHQILEPFMLRRRVEDVEGSLPPKISVVLRCKMSAVQSAIYDWVKSTGTLRLDPEGENLKIQKNPLYQAKQYKTLNNRCMELRKTCNHPYLNYPLLSELSTDLVVKSCGKLWILDRILIKLQRTGHRVLLFSTMTKLLDILEDYLNWRRLVYRRIDGTTNLDDRESAIMDFNGPDSDCFIFLLSIRAAGRGLNLQSADTVVIYDPDPNPKNEEQAVARAHRIGQKREVKVIYMEAVVDKISSHQKEDELRSGGSVDMEDELVGKDRYIGSIESLIRNNIQQYKIDMADEVINAGRFDQRTTHEERRLTLETLLHDEERYQETVHNVPSLQEVNRMIARSEEEVELFDQMDEELDWPEDMMQHDEVPEWLRANTREVNAAIAALSKRPSKNTLLGGSVAIESSEVGSERRRGRPKGKKHPNYKELEDENGEYSEASSEDRNGYSAQEEGEIGEFEDDGYSGADVNRLGEDGLTFEAGYEIPRSSESARNNHVVEEAGSSGSSSDSQRLTQTVSPSVSSQKFGSLSALDCRPNSISKRMADELEEGEIAVSGDSHMDHQQSGSWIHDRDEGEDEQVLQKPKIKRKRSLRVRPRGLAVERHEDKSGSEMISLQRGESSLLADYKYQMQTRIDPESKPFGDSSASKHDKNESSLKNKQNLPSRKVANTSKLQGSPKSNRLNCTSAPSEDGAEHPKESWERKSLNPNGSSVHGTKMTEIIQRGCKNVISKLQRRIDKEGYQIVPLLTDLWKRIENSGYAGGSGNNLLDLRKIDQRIDRMDYSGVMELVFDVQFMLRGAMNFYGYSYEVRFLIRVMYKLMEAYTDLYLENLLVRSEARKVHDLFFDILKIAFPDTDFGEVRGALSLSSQNPANVAASTRQVTVGSGKRHRATNDVETDPCPLQKPPQSGSASNGESGRFKGKDSRGGSGGGGSGREQPLTHPGQLVVCKKKRNDREKSLGKGRSGSSAAPVSPPSAIRSSGSTPKDAKLPLPHQGWGTQPSQHSNGSLGWANPVKRLRTDSGKRRPSHM
ncbi:ATP-dependent helicase BRM, partial [Mucuna pruriens]